MLGVLLWVPLVMIENTIRERTNYRQEAVHAIAASSAGEQKLWGPMLTVTVQEEFDETVSGWSKVGTANGTIRATRKHTLQVSPSVVDLTGNMDVERRKLGLLSTPVFELNAMLSGHYTAPTAKDLPSLGPNARLKWGKPLLTVGVGDPRGIAGAPVLTLAGTTLSIEGGSEAKAFSSGFDGVANEIHLDGTAKTLPFTAQVRLVGTSAFGFIPVGDVVTADISSNWPHSSFGGDFLPRTRTVQDTGFNAQWGTTAIAPRGGATPQKIQVRLIEPIDVYQ